MSNRTWARQASDHGALPSDPGETLSHFDDVTPVRLAQLLQRCGEGDVDAFETYYRLTSPILGTLVAARRLAPATADAVLVDVYVTIWRRARTFPDSGCSVWQWTLTIFLDALGQVKEPEPASRRPSAAARQSKAGTCKPSRWRRGNGRGISTVPNM